MKRSVANLPLHGGQAPGWLFKRMHRLAGSIVQLIVADYGPGEVLTRLADPHWFQAFGCVLGFDWHSSGLTTVTCGAIKEAYKRLGDDLGIHAAGGKGGVSRKTPHEITAVGDRTGVAADRLVYASKMSAKVDSAAVQDGYELYHHSFFFDDQGRWCVVQQGMCDANSYARRYHWLEMLPGGVGSSDGGEREDGASSADEHGSAATLPHGRVSDGPSADSRNDREAVLPHGRVFDRPVDDEDKQRVSEGSMRGQREDVSCDADASEGPHIASFVCEPHNAIMARALTGEQFMLNLVAAEADGCRSASVDVATMHPDKFLREVQAGPSLFMPEHHPVLPKDVNPAWLARTLAGVYENPPQTFEGLLAMKGVGAKTVRSLALIAEIIHGSSAAPSRRDPATFSLAHGGKDGFPYPVDRGLYDKNIALLERAVARAKVEPREKDDALRRLERFAQ